MSLVAVPHGRSIKSDKGIKYRVIQELGRGGNCLVCLAFAQSGPHQGVLFALKVFQRLDDAERLAQFEAEQEFLLHNNHPGIMRGFDSGSVRLTGDHGTSLFPFLVVEYFPDTLKSALGRGLRLPHKVIFALQLLSALQYLHQLEPPVVHRDIKPDNIFVKGYSCALGDFGLMRRLDDDVDDEEDRRVAYKLSAGAGMPRYYRTPDLVDYANGEGVLTSKTDVFQLGLVFAWLFCGRNPLKRADRLLDPVELESVQEVEGSTGAAIVDLIERMLVRNESEREAATDFLDSWEGVLTGVATQCQGLEGRVL